MRNGIRAWSIPQKKLVRWEKSLALDQIRSTIDVSCRSGQCRGYGVASAAGAIFSHVSFLAIAGMALVTVLLPVPIALDVIVAQQLYAHAAPAPYVMLFLATLGTFSILPMSYLWTEVSKKLAVELYALFVALGITAAYVIQIFVH